MTILQAAHLIKFAENVPWHVAMTWAHQSQAEAKAKARLDAKFAELEARADFLRKCPAAKKPVRTVSKYVGTYESAGIPKAEWARRKAKKAKDEFTRLVSVEEYEARKRAAREAAKREQTWKVKAA